MPGGEARTALIELADRIERRGLVVLGMREWPSGLVLSVTPNLCVRWSEKQYRWRQGRDEMSHADGDPEGAAEKIAALYGRLAGPAFHEQKTKRQ